MAKKRFRIKDSQGNVVPYDVAAEDVTMADGRSVEAGKASLKAVAGFLDPAHFPKLMLYNVIPLASGADVSSIPVGIVYLSESLTAPYKRLFYKKSVEGTTQSIDLGAPQDGVIYCHLSTGKLYRWEPSNSGTDGSFTQVGGDGDLKDSSGHIKQSIAAVQVLRFVSNPVAADLVDGDIYYSLGGLQYYSNGAITPLGSPSKYLTYYCVADGKFYRWNGSSMTAVTVIPHIDPQTGNWFIGATDTGMPSQGPRGNTVVLDPNQVEAFSVVNNLTEGGEEDALSAEMGKVLRRNILTIYNALGEYAFPEGKPQLDWGSGVYHPTISLNLTNLSATSIEVDGSSVNSMPADVAENSSLEFTLAIAAPAGTPSNLYVIDDDSVQVKMGGQDITSQVYDDSTGVISIDAVTDDLEIKASAITYVQDNLVLHLDCKNLGGVSGHWKSMVNYNGSPIDFTLGSSVSASESGVVFDGTLNSYGETNSSLNIAPSAATIEAVVHWDSEEYAPILSNPVASGTKLNIGLVLQRSVNKAIMAVAYNNAQVSDIIANECVSIGNANDFALSFNNQRYINKGVTTSPNEKYLFIMNSAHTKLTIGRSRRPVDDSRGDVVFIGTIKAIRVYNAVLTEAQQMQNWKVDQKRFNIS